MMTMVSKLALPLDMISDAYGFPQSARIFSDKQSVEGALHHATRRS